MNRIGIMQGRLAPPEDGHFQSFPTANWENEFPRAAEAGLVCIEWIYDRYGEDVNPLGNDVGIARMKRLSAQYGVAVRSVCADYFMDFPLVRATPAELDERLEKLAWLVGQCHTAGIQRVVLPFVDCSAIVTAADEACVTESMQHILVVAADAGVELHLETSLGPADFGSLLDRLPGPYLKANYDSGNSASLGYDPREEFAAYGERIGSVHIKDRRRGGGTVPLSTGDTDFSSVFQGLRKSGYDGDFVLQVARGPSGQEVQWAKQNLFLLQSWLGEAA